MMKVEINDALSSSLSLYMIATGKALKDTLYKAGIDIAFKSIFYMPSVAVNKDKIKEKFISSQYTVLTVTKTGKYRKKKRNGRTGLVGKESFNPSKLAYALLFSGKGGYADLINPPVGVRKQSAIKLVKRKLASSGYLKAGWGAVLRDLMRQSNVMRRINKKLMPSQRSKAAQGGAIYHAGGGGIIFLDLLNAAPGASSPASVAARDRAVAEAALDKLVYAQKKLEEQGRSLSAL